MELTVKIKAGEVNLTQRTLFQGTDVPATREAKRFNSGLSWHGGDDAYHTNAENKVTFQLDGKEVFRASMTEFMKARSAMLECMRTN